MAVIVRETRLLGGERVEGVVTYKSVRLVTAAAEKQAEKLDRELSARMAGITAELAHAGLLEKMGRQGVLELWWELGRRLAFIDALDVDPQEDRKFIWRALYDHSPKLLPGPGRARSERGDSHFLYCAMLGRLAWSFVSTSGDWTTWTEFFDSARIRADTRIVEWLGDRSSSHATPDWNRYMDSPRQDWMRPLAKEIRHRFRNRDTTILSRRELNGELDQVFLAVSNAGKTSADK